MLSELKDLIRAKLTQPSEPMKKEMMKKEKPMKKEMPMKKGKETKKTMPKKGMKKGY